MPNDALSASRVASWSSQNEASGNDATLYKSLVDSLLDYAVFAVTPDGSVMSWNVGAKELFGYSAVEVHNRPFSIIFSPEDIAAGAPAYELAQALNGDQSQYERWHIRKDGSRFWGMNTVSPLYNATGALLGFTKVVRDITASREAYNKMSQSESQLRVLLESVHDYAIVSLSHDGSVLSWNSGAEQLFGHIAGEVVGQNYSILFVPDDATAHLPAALLKKAATTGVCIGECWMLRKDGTPFLIRKQIRPLERLRNEGLDGYVMIAHDITEHESATQELRNRAYFDELTALPNRRTFFDHVRRSIATMKRSPSHLFAVLFIDLDRFKQVNDKLGHVLADEFLIAIARRFERYVRSEDVVARIGGDEFAVLLSGIGNKSEASDAAERIKADLEQAIQIGEQRITGSVSIGIAFGEVTDEKPEDILRDADAAMYSAKNNGRARAVVFDKRTFTDRVFRRVGASIDVRRAVENNELRVVYKPVVQLESGGVVGFEAQMRWEHPLLGTLEPAAFIPGLEETDVIDSLDRWMLNCVCEQGIALHLGFPRDIPLELCMKATSRRSLRPEFLYDLGAALIKTGFPVSSLRIDITENAIMEQEKPVETLIAALRALGVSVDVDEFGMGSSCLAVLGLLAVNSLKITSSFVKNLDSRRGLGIVETIITLAHKLGLIAIAEGIETQQQLAQLVALGCDLGQGLLFGAPQEVHAVTRLSTTL